MDLPQVSGLSLRNVNRGLANSHPVALMDSIRPYINWQTTIEYLKDPPAEYAEKIQEPYDFYAEYERIYAQAKSGSYANEYAFGHELYIAFQRTHDGHFVSQESSRKVSYASQRPSLNISPGHLSR